MIQLYYQNFHRSHPLLVPRKALAGPLCDRLPAYVLSIMRYVDPPIVVKGSLRDLLPVAFELVGAVHAEASTYSSRSHDEVSGGSETFISLNLGPWQRQHHVHGDRTSRTAEGQLWDQKVSALEHIVCETRWAGGRISADGIAERQPGAEVRYLRLVDCEQRTTEVSQSNTS